jgi:hypothetical protein
VSTHGRALVESGDAKKVQRGRSVAWYPRGWSESQIQEAEAARAEGKAETGEPEAPAAPELEDDQEDDADESRKLPERTNRHAPDPVGDRDERASAMQKQNRAVVSFFREHPNSTAKDCSDALGIEQGACRKLILGLMRGKMAGRAQLYTDEGNPPRYRTRSEITEADSNGARTQQEREIVNVLRATPGLTGVELADYLSRPAEQLSGVLMAMVRRGVLTIDSGQYGVAEQEAVAA